MSQVCLKRKLFCYYRRLYVFIRFFFLIAAMVRTYMNPFIIGVNRFRLSAMRDLVQIGLKKNVLIVSLHVRACVLSSDNEKWKQEEKQKRIG